MQLALRPYATAGVALLSATAIVSSPVMPPPELRIAAPIVQPLASFQELFENTSANLATLLPALTTDPLPVLTQILENNVNSATSILGPTVDIVVGGAGYVLRLPVTAVQAIQALFAEDGGIGAAVRVLVEPLVPLVGDGIELFNAIVPALQQPFQNIANALGTVTLANVGAVALSLVSPLLATVVATVDAVSAVVDAVFGDNASLDGTVRALVNFIPTIADGFLNGTAVINRTIDLPVPLPDVHINGGVGGLLSTGAFNLDIGLRDVNVDIATSGPIAAVNNYLHTLADAITPLAPSPTAAGGSVAPLSINAGRSGGSEDLLLASGGQDPSGGGAEPGGQDPSGGGGQPGGQDPSGGGGQPGGQDPSGGGGQPGGQDPSGGGGQPGGQDPSGGGGQPGGQDPSGAGGQPGGQDPAGAGVQKPKAADPADKETKSHKKRGDGLKKILTGFGKRAGKTQKGPDATGAAPSTAGSGSEGTGNGEAGGESAGGAEG